MRPFYLFLCGLLICLGSLNLNAQQEKWEGGFFVGSANYLGDIVETNPLVFKQSSIAFGFMVKRNLTETLGLRLGLNSGMLSAEDSKNDSEGRALRGFSFENRLTELALLGQWEILGNKRYGSGNNFNKIVSPYIFAGVGLGFSNPTADFNDHMRPGITLDQAAEVQQALFTVPFGGGIRLDLNRKWVLGLEVGLRPAFNDYVDGVSEAGNPDENDWWAFSGLTATMRFGEKDSDGDGVKDDSDKCPNTPGLSSVGGCPDADLDGIPDAKDGCPEVAGEEKFNGCPDTDDDGVADNQDNCPNIAGERRYRGCPDTDGDGIADPLDICPRLAGVPSLDGCPDADGDGITDADDACPNLAGLESANGCPDTDGDGFIDPTDKCPEIPGTAEFNGCPDTDGDGIGDGDDRCPSNVGPARNNGCPEIEEDDLATLQLAMKNVRFRSSSNEILTLSYPIMDEVAEIMSRYPNYILTISGYSDNVGNDVANQNLSKRRAQSCYQYLLVKGVPGHRMSHTGYGETNPIADNKTPEGRAINRRVEFELTLPKN